MLYSRLTFTSFRDCAYQNIRLDATPMFPDGFHPVLSGLLPDMSASSRPIPRSTTAGVTYYFIDFGISVQPPSDVGVTLVVGCDGLDQEPPELHQDHPYDPFKLDIFIIGNLFRRRFLDVSPVSSVSSSADIPRLSRCSQILTSCPPLLNT